MKRQKKEKLVRTIVYITPELSEHLKRESELRDESVSSIISQILSLFYNLPG